MKTTCLLFAAGLAAAIAAAAVLPPIGRPRPPLEQSAPAAVAAPLPIAAAPPPIAASASLADRAGEFPGKRLELDHGSGW